MNTQELKKQLLKYYLSDIRLLNEATLKVLTFPVSKNEKLGSYYQGRCDSLKKVLSLLETQMQTEFQELK